MTLLCSAHSFSLWCVYLPLLLGPMLECQCNCHCCLRSFFSVCTFLLTTTIAFFVFAVFTSMLFLHRIFAQCHIFVLARRRISLRLLFCSVYLFIPHTHTHTHLHIYLFRPFLFPQKKVIPKWFFCLRLPHTTFFVVVRVFFFFAFTPNIII